MEADVQTLQTKLSVMMSSMQETFERVKTKESNLDDKEKKLEEREYNVARRENDVKEREECIERRENSVEERHNNVVDSEKRCVAVTRQLQLQQDGVDERAKALKDFELELESKSQELCMQQEVLQKKLDALAQQELIVNENMAAVKRNNVARLAELNPEIRSAAKLVEMKEDHLKFLKRQLNEKNNEIKEMELTTSKVKLLTVLKSDACKISAEVKELVLLATEEADKTLEALTMDNKLKLFRDMIQFIRKFAESLKNQKLQVDMKEGRALATFESMSKLSNELDEKVLKLEASFKERDLQIKKQEKLEKVLKNDFENLRIGVTQLAKDKQSWRRMLQEEDMNEREERFGGFMLNAKQFVNSCKIHPR